MTFQKRMVGLAVLLGAVAFLGKAWLIAHYGSTVPYGDQWDVECRLYAAWREGSFRWEDLLTPANEHRIVFTKLINLGLFLANGYWDPLVQMVAGAIAYSGLIVLVGAWVLVRIPREKRPVLLGLLGWAAVLPLTWENTLWGCQSQFYLMILLAWGALWGWCAGGGPVRRVVGGLCLLGGPFAMASGVLAAPVVIAVRVLGALVRKQWSRTDWLAVGVATAAMGLSAAFWTHVPQHDFLRTTTWAEFSLVVLQLLSWPWPGTFLLGIVLWLPWLVLSFALLTGRKALTERALVFVGLGAWVLALILSIAWGRGTPMLGMNPPSRYVDVLWWGPILNGCILMIPWRGGRLAKRRQAVLLAGWLTIVIIGSGTLAWWTIQNVLAQRRGQILTQLAQISQFLTTDDFGKLTGRGYTEIAYPWPERLAEHLQRARSAKVLSPELHGTDYPFAQAEGVSRTGSYSLGWGADLPAWRSPEGRHGRFFWQSREFLLEAGTWTWKTCALGAQGAVSFEIVAVDPSTQGERVATVHAQSIGGWQRWETTLPCGVYRFRVHDLRDDGLVAWAAPVRLGPLTRATGWLLKHALLLATVASMGLVMLVAWQSVKIRVNSGPVP